MDPETVDDLLEIAAVEVDDGEFETHLLNYGKVQQTNVTGQDRTEKEGLVLCRRLVEVVHGKDAGKPCTLAVFEWYVQANEPDKRFKFVQINTRFKSSADDEHHDPVVVDCFPWGAYSLASWTKKLEKTRGWHPTINLGYKGTATFENTFVYDLKETADRDEHIYVSGGPMLADNYTDPDNLTAVQWSSFESESQRSGIPRYFRTAVLLQRKIGDTARFTAKIDMKYKVSALHDVKEKIKTFLGRNVKDDPAIFDPSEPPKTDRFNASLESLQSVSLKDECVFLLFKTFSETQEIKKNDKNGKESSKQNESHAS